MHVKKSSKYLKSLKKNEVTRIKLLRFFDWFPKETKVFPTLSALHVALTAWPVAKVAPYYGRLVLEGPWKHTTTTSGHSTCS